MTILTKYTHHKTFNQPSEPEALSKYLNIHFPEATYYSAYEAEFCGIWLHYKLEDSGINNIVITPADIPKTRKDKLQKTDAMDSRKIARSLRGQELKGIHIPYKQTLSDRSPIRMRTSTVKDLNRLKQRLKMMLV